MGVGWTPELRNSIVTSASIRAGNNKSEPDVEVFVVDGCTLRGRLTFVQSPEQAARGIVKWLSSRTKTFANKTISIIFDNAERMPPQRAEVAASRSKRCKIDTSQSDPLPDYSDLSELTPGHLTTLFDWDVLLAKAETKKIAWELLGRSLFNALMPFENCSVEIMTAGNRFTREYESMLLPYSPSMHGEADILVRRRASDYSRVGKVVEIISIDYDQVLQALVTTGPCAKYGQFKQEVINLHCIRESFGGQDIDRRLSAAFFLLCACASDYSKGICRLTGCKKKDFVLAMQSGSCVVELEIDSEKETSKLFLNPKCLLSLFKRDPRGLDLKNAIERILWTICYFAEFDSYRKQWAGPEQIEIPDDWISLEKINVCSNTYIKPA